VTDRDEAASCSPRMAIASITPSAPTATVKQIAGWNRDRSRTMASAIKMRDARTINHKAACNPRNIEHLP
jgi:hypothetical protein